MCIWGKGGGKNRGVGGLMIRMEKRKRRKREKKKERRAPTEGISGIPDTYATMRRVKILTE